MTDQPTTAAPTHADKPMVYVVEQQPFNYDPAAKYGTLYFLRTAKLAPQNPVGYNEHNESVIHRLKRELSEYVPGRDYVIPTGAPTKLLMVGMLLAQLGPRHRLLGWDARLQDYLEYVIEI